MTIWMEVTQDEYELPVAVADTSFELCRMRGLEKRTVLKDLWRWKNGKAKRCKYRKVEIDDEPDQDS